MSRIQGAKEESSAKSDRQASDEPFQGRQGVCFCSGEEITRMVVTTVRDQLCEDCLEKIAPLRAEGDLNGVLDYKGYCEKCSRMVRREEDNMMKELGYF